MTALAVKKGLIISTAGLTKVYQGRLGRKPTPALNDVSFEIVAGESCGLIGPNGAGKSTLIKVILGLEKCDRGTVTIIGSRDRRLMGFVPERPAFFEDLNARQNLLYYARISGIVNPDSRVDETLRELKLYERRMDAVSVYSKGMRQKLAIARAIIHEPPILIMDEPFSGLDPSYVLEIRDHLSEMNSRGVTILLSSHDLSEIEKLCDSAIFLNRGKVVKREYYSENDTTLPFKITLDGPAKGILSRLDNDYKIEVADDHSSFIFFSGQSCLGNLISEIVSLGGNIIELKRVERTIEDTYIELFGRAADERV